MRYKDNVDKILGMIRESITTVPIEHTNLVKCTFLVPDVDYGKLKVYVKLRNTSISELLRSLIHQYVCLLDDILANIKVLDIDK